MQAGSFFSVCKMPNFVFQLQEVTCNLRFWRRSGSIDRPVSTCRRGRRCPVALCATNKGKKCKQVVFSVCKMPNFVFQLQEVTFNLRFWRRSGSSDRPVSTCRRGDVVLSPRVRLASASQAVKRWWQFSVIWMPRFSNLDAAIQ